MSVFKRVFIFLFAISLILILLLSFKYFSKAYPTKANITINTKKIIGKIPENWKALAQGGEERGRSMFENVIPQVLALNPKYIRIDHIYDFYNVVNRDSSGNLTLNWTELDNTVCDIYHTGAKPFFSLGYMPKVISSDGSLISAPNDWNEWSLIVQKTIEHYSGKSTILCNSIKDYWLNDIYYEVWNEPDLEAFGKWSIHGGKKDYRTLYYYSALGAKNAQNVYYFHLGGPSTTALYKTWMSKLLDYIDSKKLRIDFLSWHHYTVNPDDYLKDSNQLNSWLSQEKYRRFQSIPKIITEWGYDSNPNLVSETNVGAAHTVMSIRNLIDENINMAFAFEVKDGNTPTWGILTKSGSKKPRYNALKFLNNLKGSRLQVNGEGQFVRAIASYKDKKVYVILVNYDQNNSHSEHVPVTFFSIKPGIYSFQKKYLSEDKFQTENLDIKDFSIKKNIIMPANSVVLLILEKKGD